MDALANPLATARSLGEIDCTLFAPGLPLALPLVLPWLPFPLAALAASVLLPATTAAPFATAVGETLFAVTAAGCSAEGPFGGGGMLSLARLDDASRSLSCLAAGYGRFCPELLSPLPPLSTGGALMPPSLPRGAPLP
jgi:hypothetical protein